MKKILSKVLIVFAGILFFLIIIEISLRIFGYFYEAKTKTNNIFNKNNYTILCIGDSHTKGIGAPKGFDYPTQLSKLLNQNTNIKFNVINCGIPGNNSSNILERLPIEINKYNPSLVIFLAGLNNRWNNYGNNSSKVNHFINKIKVVKLINLLINNISDKKLLLAELNRDDLLKNDEVFTDNLNILTKILNKNPEDDKTLYKIGFLYFNAAKYNEAIKYIEKAIKINNKEALYYNTISVCFKRKGEFDKSLKYLEKGLNENKDKDFLLITLALLYNSEANYNKTLETVKHGIKSNPLCINFYQQLSSLYNIKEDIDKEIIDFYKNYPIDLSKKYYTLGIDTKKIVKRKKVNIDNETKKWIQNDLGNILNIINQKGIRLIIMNYYSKISINILLKEFAEKNHIPFVDNNKTFIKLGKDYIKYQEPIGYGFTAHPNAKGYGLMAKNIYNKIIEEKIYKIDTMKESSKN